MQAIMQKLLCVAVICAICMPSAWSEEKDSHGETVSAWPLREKGMAYEHAETMAEMVFGDEILAGKLTLPQAASYCKCAQDDYVRRFYQSASGKKYMKTLARLTESEGKHARKMKLQRELDRLLPKLDRQMHQAESRCMKKLGLKVIRGKAFGRTRRAGQV